MTGASLADGRFPYLEFPPIIGGPRFVNKPLKADSVVFIKSLSIPSELADYSFISEQLSAPSPEWPEINIILQDLFFVGNRY